MEVTTWQTKARNAEPLHSRDRRTDPSRSRPPPASSRPFQHPRARPPPAPTPPPPRPITTPITSDLPVYSCVYSLSPLPINPNSNQAQTTANPTHYLYFSIAFSFLDMLHAVSLIPRTRTEEGGGTHKSKNENWLGALPYSYTNLLARYEPKMA